MVVHTRCERGNSCSKVEHSGASQEQDPSWYSSIVSPSMAGCFLPSSWLAVGMVTCKCLLQLTDR